MTVDQIASALARQLWLQPLEIEEETKDKQLIVFGSPSGIPLFAISVQRVGIEDWRILGSRADLQDHMRDLTEVVHGKRDGQ